MAPDPVHAALYDHFGYTQLRPHQLEVLQHLANAEDMRTIAAKLGISHATVRNHVQHILSATKAHSISEVTARFVLGDYEGDEPSD